MLKKFQKFSRFKRLKRFKKQIKSKILRKVSFLRDTRFNDIIFKLNDNRKKLYKLLILYCYFLNYFFKYYTFLYFKQCSQLVSSRLKRNYRYWYRVYNKKKKRFITKRFHFWKRIKTIEDVLYKRIQNLYSFLYPINKGLITYTFNDLFIKLLQPLKRASKREVPKKGKNSKLLGGYLSIGKLKFIIRLIRRYMYKYRRVFKLLPSENRLYFTNLQYLKNILLSNKALHPYFYFISLKCNRMHFINFFNHFVGSSLRYATEVSHLFFLNNMHAYVQKSITML
jgi:hypothetical protein